MRSVADMADRPADNEVKSPDYLKEHSEKIFCSYKNLSTVKVQKRETPPKNPGFWGGFVSYFVNLREPVSAGSLLYFFKWCMYFFASIKFPNKKEDSVKIK